MASQQEVKRQVCWDASVILQSALDSNIHGDMSSHGGPDEERFLKAWSGLIKELRRRGRPSDTTGSD